MKHFFLALFTAFAGLALTAQALAAGPLVLPPGPGDWTPFRPGPVEFDGKTYTLDDTDPAVQALNGAATLTDTFNAVTVDGTALVLDTAAREPLRIGSELHLPLPPAATSRQIRDAAESWLRDEALRIFTKSALAGRHPARVVLCFGKRRDWAKREGGDGGEGNVLRCHWRLIEQPLGVVEQVLGHALSQGQAAQVSDDLFALV